MALPGKAETLASDTASPLFHEGRDISTSVCIEHQKYLVLVAAISWLSGQTVYARFGYLLWPAACDTLPEHRMVIQERAVTSPVHY